MRRLYNDSRPIHYETVLGTRVATGTPEGGQSIILHMSYIDKKIQEVVKEIIAKEFEEATRS